jgi:hypothetical protein
VEPEKVYATNHWIKHIIAKVQLINGSLTCHVYFIKKLIITPNYQPIMG